MSLRHAPILLLVAAVVLAGCSAPRQGHAHEATGLDTGDIAPGKSRTLTCEEGGTLAMHCHPHPFMLHNVTVTGAPAGPAHVHIFDGETPEESRFEPAELTVGRGGEVTYHNHGSLVHTATPTGDA